MREIRGVSDLARQLDDWDAEARTEISRQLAKEDIAFAAIGLVIFLFFWWLW